MPFVKGIGAPELIIVLLIVLVVFGVGRLPEVGGGLGKGIREFRRALSGKGEGDEESSTESTETESDDKAV